MPPKKGGKKGGKKGKGDGGGEDGGKLSLDEQVSQLNMKCTSLQLQLRERTEATTEAMAASRKYEAQFNEMNSKLEDEQKGTMEITKAMTRQYEAMQEQLVDRITDLENTVQNLRDKLEEAELHLEQTVRDKDRVIRSKDEEIGTMKAKMEDMAQEFGGMLKETLDKMRERIQLSNTQGIEAGAGVPIQRGGDHFKWGGNEGP